MGTPQFPAFRLPVSADFGIEVDFTPDTEDPARVFRTMTQLIEACQLMDEEFAAAFGATIKPVLLLEGIETGSITTWLRAALQSVDEDALKSGDWKKIVGAYLVKGKRTMVEFLQDRTTISNAQEIYDLQVVIREAANETGLPLVQDPPVLVREVADSVRLLSEATLPLREGDEAMYITHDGAFPINTAFHVTTEKIEEVLTQETIINHDEMILKVKKPDFLGESMWDFRYEGKRITAKIADVGWLKSFRDGEVTLYPGDAIKALVEVESKYGLDKEVIVTHYRILRVEQIINRKGPG